ncbi:MAG: hypothetical protein KGL18_21255 [Burkholderiales bacterium]|nr:hypothetical protein [Burkholderiales bacterium]MDE1929470.1 hypothetical protein [Burkholderiales bacterium]MDE2159483.1 hypothetical protein [Burkholderiales bacterium]MDE2505499.1 hypothetical protein [Burkholderiales bacterium]
MPYIDPVLTVLALGVALALRPWRLIANLPWPALAWWAALPWVWEADRSASVAVLQPLSGACLLVLMIGWPLAVPALLALVVLLGATGMPWDAALHRGVWLGLVPATLALALGGAVRRWLPHHLFVYILGRGFLVTGISLGIAGLVSALLFDAPPGISPGDLALGRFLTGAGEAFLTGMLTAIFVAFKPQWLATYTDRLYLPRP